MNPMIYLDLISITWINMTILIIFLVLICIAAFILGWVAKDSWDETQYFEHNIVPWWLDKNDYESGD
jgi:ABC-type transport system involved in cytochrome bd biosynthesis fused ATPase/permease subunit